MQLNAKKFASAAALTVGILYIVCAIFVALWPDFAMQLLGQVAHIVNVDKFAGDVAITASGVIAGLVEVMIYAYVSSWIFAGLYNRFVK
ncbi:MAG: DUF5676 family membrane protein [Patescibacteria group bacterium]